ncbi:MAG: geopeptide radical SAM maturase [Thermodesulfobacteriota bacterium]
MPPSCYLLAIPLPERPGSTLIFSTRKGSSCLVPDALWQRLCQGEVADPADPTIATLARLGLLVADPTAERTAVLNLIPTLNRLNPGVTVAVVLGMACNFACRYCYEGKLKGRLAMNDQTAAALTGFVASRLTPAKDRLVVDFYGGEPLLYLPRLKKIAASLQTLASQRGVRYSFTLVTNGSRLRRPLVQELVDLGLSAVKVTVDGPAAIHDRLRPYRSGRGSLTRILDNLADCWDLVRIGVATNYTADTYQAFPALLDTLQSRGLGPGQLAQLSCHPAVRAIGRHALATACGFSSTDEPWLVPAALTLHQAVTAAGYRTPQPGPAPCMADLDDAFTVHADGTLYKCPGLIGHSQFAVGDLWQGFRDVATVYDTGRLARATDCHDCLYLPLCLGGCRFVHFQRTGSIQGLDCQKAFLSATLPDLLHQQVAAQTRS